MRLILFALLLLFASYQTWRNLAFEEQLFDQQAQLRALQFLVNEKTAGQQEPETIKDSLNYEIM